jgi:4-alpha-glucanotransferase
METLAEWWESAPPDERVALLGLVTGNNDPARALARPDLDAETRDRVLEALYAAGSDLLVLPVQDLFGWPDRINRPGTLGGANWMYRLKWPVDRLAIEDEPRARAAVLQVWAERYGRS